MNAEIQKLRDQVAADNVATKANLANVASDIANLNTQIQTLNAKIAAGTPLDADDLAAFAAIAASSADLVTTTKALADATPDVPATT